MSGEDMSFRQRAVIEGPLREEIPALGIHARIQRADGESCMGAKQYQMMSNAFSKGTLKTSLISLIVFALELHLPRGMKEKSTISTEGIDA
jgi:hypothetical protein